VEPGLGPLPRTQATHSSFAFRSRGARACRVSRRARACLAALAYVSRAKRRGL